MDTGHPDAKMNTETKHGEESATDHKTSHTPKIESEDVVNTKFVNDLIHLDDDNSSEIPIIEQKHKSNYNRLHFLIYLLHILQSISTNFSLLQE